MNLKDRAIREHADQAVLLYYYRPLRRYPNVYKCAGHGAEDPKHRSFYEPYFSSHDKDLVYAKGCIVSPYKGDRATAEKLEAK